MIVRATCALRASAGAVTAARSLRAAPRLVSGAISATRRELQVASGLDQWSDPFPAASEFEELFKPLGEATTMPGSVYWSKAWYRAEKQRLFAPSWQFIGRADELPETGSYLTANLPGVGPVVVVRDKNGDINAFANVCRHRGAVLLRQEQGQLNGPGMACPYHAWLYGLDGTLRGAPKCKRADGTSTIDKRKLSLKPIRLEEFCGFLFVNGAGDEAPSLQASLGNAKDLVFQHWPLEDMTTVGRKEYVVNCNWKFLFENTSETYHTSYVHKSTLGPMASMSIEEHTGVSPDGNWDAVHVPTEGRSVVPLPGEDAPFPNVAPGTYFVNLFPTVQLNVTHDCAWWMRMLPIDEMTTRVTQGFLFPRATTKIADFAEHLKPYLYRWELAVIEDNEISENQQMGCSSESYVPGPYNDLEFATHKLDKFIAKAVLGADAPDTA